MSPRSHWGLSQAIAAILAVFVCALCGGTAAAQTATVNALTGQTCAGTRFGDNLNCTANDFSSSLTFTQPLSGAIANCLAGTTISLDIIATTTSNSPQRYDGGYFLGENGISPALNTASSSCSLAVFPETPAPFSDFDGDDSCGDYASSSVAPAFGLSTLQINDAQVLCSAVPGTSLLALPYVLVFSNNTGSAPPNACAPGNITASTKSKCVANVTATVTGVTVNGYVTVTKQTLPDAEPGSFSFTTAADPVATVVPAAASLGDGNTQTFEVPLALAGDRMLTVTEAALSGWDPTASISCTTPSGGSAASYVTIDNGARTITATLNSTNFGAVCTVINGQGTPQLTLNKTANVGSVDNVGDSISYTIAVSNSGDVTLTNVAVMDPLGTVVCPTSGTNIIATMIVGATENCTLNYAAMQADFDGNGGGDGDIDNTATAATTYGTANVSASASTAVTLVLNASIEVTKVSLTPGPVNVDDVITYKYRVKNTGNRTLSAVGVTDAHTAYGEVPVPGSEVIFADVAPLLDSADGGSDGVWDTLRAQDTVEFTGTYTVLQADIDNLQ